MHSQKRAYIWNLNITLTVCSLCFYRTFPSPGVSTLIDKQCELIHRLMK